MWLRKEKIIFEAESSGMRIQVIDKMERREMRFGNNVVQSAISKACPDFLLLSYTRHMMLGFVLNPDAERILHIGLGAGNIPRFIHKHFPDSVQKVIEPSPEVIEAAHQYFNLPRDERISFLIGDGFAKMSRCEENYDLIFSDAFGAEGTPDHLNTSEFFSLLQSSLNPGGWVVGNVWTSNMPLEEQIEKWQDAFEVVLQAPVPIMGNVVLFGGNSSSPLKKHTLHQTARVLQKRVPLKFADFLEYLEPIQDSQIV
ncbi:MAG: fused MFS/spermidine synthase [SAR324 cluster bacterium]|nr:fused MFS/spermidine synthase [SAR324 cluster bacterium]